MSGDAPDPPAVVPVRRSLRLVPDPAPEPVPAGKLRVVVTHLAMTAPPTRPPHPAPLQKLALLRAEEPTVSFYRYLYNTVGEPWLWADRRPLDDAALADIVRRDSTRIFVLYVSGVPAGFAELDRRGDTVQIVYFGLVPEFLGRRLGAFFLDAIVHAAWTLEPRRLAVETCNLDHPRAITLYQRAGFVPEGQEVRLRDDPRVLGLIPPGAAPQHPIAG